MARIDPFERLGLKSKSSLAAYTFMGKVRSFNGDDTEEGAYQNVDPSQYYNVSVHLKYRLPGIVDYLAFNTLRSVSSLQPFIVQLLNKRFTRLFDHTYQQIWP